MKIKKDGELGYDAHQMARPGHGGHHGYQDVAWGAEDHPYIGQDRHLNCQCHITHAV